MKRPLVVTAIACYAWLAGIYLCAIATFLLIMPRTASTLRHAPFVHGIKLGGPYLGLTVGIGWAIVGWGLLLLRDWARLIAMLLLGIGIASEVSMMVVTGFHRWQLLAVVLEISLRAGSVWYLLTPATIDVFMKDRAAPFDRALP